MSHSASRPSLSAAITFGIFGAVVLAASALRFASELDGWLGIVFLLLILGAPIFIAVGAAVTVWRLMANLLPQALGVPERMLFTLGTFVTFCGCSPLAISLAIMEITRREGTLGAAGMWALTSIVAGAFLAILGLAITVLRFALHRLADGKDE
jgi:hypothetical protein